MMEYVTLSNGIKMPILGYGVYQVTKEECEHCVLDALSVGYRHIDTAQSYFNEEEVGSAIEKSGVPREDIFLTTKVWIEHYGYEQTKASVAESLRKLKTDYLDLVLLPMLTVRGEHWKNYTMREKSARSESPTFMPIVWSILRLSTASNLWSIRWKRIFSISKKI